MCYSKHPIMANFPQKLLLFLLVCHAVAAAKLRQIDEIISFTEPLYHGRVQEKAVSSLVESDRMMGMWLTGSNSNVRFDIEGENRGFQASRKIAGNFIFLELRTALVNRDQDVRVRATSRDQETFCTVHVSVMDVNDFQPLFPPHPYSTSVDEDTKVGTTIIHVKATDSDRDFANTRLYYSLPESTSDSFAVHPTTGAVSLTAKLNAKNQATHLVVIQATDRRAALAGNAQPKKTTLTVTVNPVNEHSPEIIVRQPLSFDSSISANSAGRSRVYAVVQVRDSDSGRNGRTSIPLITHSDIPDLLAIERSGSRKEYLLVFTRDPPPMNGIVNVTLQVSDRGKPARVTRKTVQVKLFDRQSLIPLFESDSFVLNVSEISPVFTQVGFVSAKVRSGNPHSSIRYAIVGGNNGGRFAINERTSLITTAKKLNKVAKRQYRITVAATNVLSVDFNAQNRTVVTVNVQDANDHDPVFEESYYAESISENAPVGSLLTRVRAHDADSGANGTVTYSLLDSSGLPFAIDPFNGTIYTTGMLDSDVFSRSTFELRVRASDSGSPFNRKSECSVSVRISNANDNPPVFNEIDCVVTIPDTTPKDSRILQLDPIDIDRDRVTCQLTSGGDGWFAAEPLTCELRLVADLNSAGQERSFSLLVTASDGTHTSDPVSVNVSVVSGSKVIAKSCRDTGAIGRLEESMNSLRLSNSRPGEGAKTGKLNRTSQLLNKYKPKLMSRSPVQVVRVPEDAKLQQTITRVRASDRDSGYNGKLWYTITAGNEDSCFVINPQNGRINLARPLDRESTPSYSLTVKVSDLGTPPKSTIARLKFVVTDVNDNSPTFVSNQYAFALREDAPIGYRIRTRIEASDADLGDNARIRYRLLPHFDDGDHFFIDPITGYINVTGQLDREAIPEYNLTVIATDSAPLHPRSTSATVLVRLLDVNDNAPQFHQSLYRIRVSEDLPEHAVVFWLQAHDRDEGENSAVRYTLTDGTANRNDGVARFSVDDRTGAIRLSSSLNSTVQSRYNITARARDSMKLYSTCYIEVEVLPVNRNLHAPYFEYRDIRIEVAENVAIGTEVGVVSAVDEDLTYPERSIGYHIIDGTGLGFFAIDQNTGRITTLKSLDRETEQYYWLTVVAEDRASIPLSGHVFVLVEIADVNDNAPQPLEPIYFAKILENSERGSKVTRIKALDRDAGPGGNVTFSMDANRYFDVDPISGVITTTVKKLDRETIQISQLSFDVTITDQGSPSLASKVRVVVEIDDVNDHAPQFINSKTKIYLPERNRTHVPMPLTRVVALDADAGSNADIDYVLERSRKFTIDPKSGIISSSKAFKKNRKSTLRINAFDLGDKQKQSKFRLEIDWQAAPERSRLVPSFDERVGNIQECYFEHVEKGFVVDEAFNGRNVLLLQANDPDSIRLWFRIVAGNTDHMFDINGDDMLYVAGEPDAETTASYNLTVEVTDGYNKATKQIRVPICDVNDNRPVFIEKVFHASIDENMPPNSRVVSLSVTDADLTERNRNFIFKIRGSVDPASASQFRIASDGTIYTTARLDRESNRKHILFVEVDDQGVPGALQSFCHVIVSVTDRNEHAPQFTAPAYFGQVFASSGDIQVGVDETSERIAVRVSATDRDFGRNARIFYSIHSGNVGNIWKINPSSGEISLGKDLLSPDGSPLERSTLQVRATDGGEPPLFSTCEVTIDVKRPESARPRFELDKLSVEIPENAGLGSFVAMVTATAASGLTYSFASTADEEHFSLNPNSGVISLAAGLDREQRDRYELNVTCVSTEGEKAAARVFVRVLDVNDNRPRFLSRSYVGYVTESTTSTGSASVIDEHDRPLVVSASDSDLENNQRISYRIQDPSSEIARRFSVHPNTGAVRVNSGENLFDFESVKEYKFKVSCHDLGNPRLHASNPALVTVRVRDANDTVLAFTKSRYDFDILLPTAEGVVVSGDARVSGADLRTTRADFLVYSISDGNDRSAFKVDPRTGSLSVSDSAALSDGDVFNLKLRVTDVRRSSVAHARITASTLPASSGLSFTEDVYHSTVKENSTEVRDLLVTHVVGVALEDNLRFRILNPNPSFRIAPTSGVIVTTGIPLDREVKAVHELLVEVLDVNLKSSDGDDVVKRGRCRVRMRVTDVNDNSPRFRKDAYHAIVQVDAQPATVVKQVQAVDADVGRNGVVSYSLEGRHANMFDVDANHGVVTLRRTPDVGMDGGNVKYNVTLVAHDMGVPSLVGRAILIVSVVNRATPVFSRSFYGDISVTEGALSHVVVSDAVKASSPDDSDIVFTIEDGDPLQQFDIDFHVGTITTRGSLDREFESRYRLRIRARNAQSPAHADAEVEIKVADVNDNAPVFEKLSYSATIPETARVGTAVAQVTARDADSLKNGQISYRILDDVTSSDGGYFHIDQDTGVIWMARSVDYETKSQLDFVVRASDHGTPMLHTDVGVNVWVTDVNDNPPVFEKTLYRYQVSAEAGAGDFVGIASAWDPDPSDRSKLSYSIQNPDNDRLLEIDSQTGIVTLAGRVDSPIESEVTVTDGVFVAAVGFEVEFTREETSPTPVVFKKSSYSFQLEENVPSGLTIGRVSAAGLGPLSYSIEDESLLADMFRVDRITGRIETTMEVDREAVQRHQPDKDNASTIEFRVTAVDSRGIVARCRVLVEVLDRNDNAPEFLQSKYGAVLAPGNQYGHSVINLTANDQDVGANGRISYAWHESSAEAQKYFTLGSDSGEVKLSNPTLPFGDEDVLQFFVRARDNGAEVSQSNVVAVSIYLATSEESVPRFEPANANATLAENSSVGSYVTTVHASTDDQRRVIYELASPYIGDVDNEGSRATGQVGANGTGFGAINQKFAVDPSTGRITTASTLDREEQASHVITVLAYVETTPELIASAQVVVTLTDVNDNSPQFTSSLYRASIVENSPKRTDVMDVIARDLDEGSFGSVTYSLESNDGQALPFSINKKTGLIVTSASLDREVRSRYDLVVIASDEADKKRRQNSTCHVIVDVIDVNDKPPKFTQSLFRAAISESAPIGQIVSHVIEVTDGDNQSHSELQVYIIEGDPDRQFEVTSSENRAGSNATTAGIRVVRALDREVTSSYTLTVLATDGLHTDKTQLLVEIDDVNDSAPSCQQLTYYGSAAENAPAHFPILRIRSPDADSGANGRIAYELSGEGANNFTIDTETGELFANAGLDREVTSQYWLTVTSSDAGGRSCESQVFIRVDDVNDETPRVEPLSLEGATKEDTPVGSLIHRVLARDGDLGKNGSFLFSLSDDAQGQFHIEPETGVVVLRKPLDRETIASYQLEVKVTDRGTAERLSSTSLLRLKVLDINDNPPIFDRNQYEVWVKEDVEPGQLVAQVSAESADAGTNAEMRYVIARGNEHGRFRIDPFTGQVYLVSKLDYETDQNYVLTISASDHSDAPLSADCTLRVNVTDVNDNPPQFALPRYHAPISEDASTDDLIISVSAVDRDTGAGGNVTYYLSAQSSATFPFRIDATSGQLFVAHPGLDYERQHHYSVIVIAADAGVPPLRSEVVVEVSVTDINDNRPEFCTSAPPEDKNSKVTCSPDGANCTVYVHESSNEPVLQGIALLNATDADGTGNGAPFRFRILDGNDEGLFYLDDDNVLKSRKPLLLEDQRLPPADSRQIVHHLHIEAADSGRPALTARPNLSLNIVVLQENRFAPEMTPHHVQISTPDGQFSGDLITNELHVTDQDAFDRDRIRFSLANAEDFEQFSIDPLSGALTTRWSLPVGWRNVTVRVSDGLHSTFSTVSISVVQIETKALENSVSISFSGIASLEEYIERYHNGFVKKLKNALPGGFEFHRDLLIMSLQRRNGNVVLLFGIRIPPGASSTREFYSSKSLKGFLQKSRMLLTPEGTGVQVDWIDGTICVVESCSGTCLQVPTLRSFSTGNNRFRPVTTINYSLLTSPFNREETCACPLGTIGRNCDSICSAANNPCTKEDTCIVDMEETQGYRCEPPAPTNTIMAFSGRGYVQYTLDTPPSDHYRMHMRLRTFQSNATVFFTEDARRHWTRLETSGGCLRFTFDCGSGQQTMMQRQRRVNNGKWNKVEIESRPDGKAGACAFVMTINNKYVASAKAPGFEPRLDVSTITFGAMSLRRKAKRSADLEQSKRHATRNHARQGFRGCLSEVSFNDASLSLGSSSGLHLDAKRNVINKCRNSDIDMGACNTSPCLNGGHCLPRSDGAHECACPQTHTGERCEYRDPCRNIPCKNQGYCYSDGKDVRCECGSNFIGAMCETPVCRATGPCYNGGTCVTLNGRHQCSCSPGWTGKNCDISASECLKRCGNERSCYKEDGQHFCNCTLSEDQFCASLINVPVDVDSAFPTLYVVIGSILLLVVIIVAVVLVRCWAKRKGDSYNEDYIPHQPPPRIPPPPRGYHPSSRDSFNVDGRQWMEEQLDQRPPPVGLVHPQSPPVSAKTPLMSDSDSVRKPSPSWPDYDPMKFADSTPSSVRHHPSSGKPSSNSINEQQSFHWDDMGIEPASDVPSTLNSPEYARARPLGAVPGSPTSHGSLRSASTCRSRHGDRSGALSGHYNKGERRVRKQLSQMLLINKDMHSHEEIELHHRIPQMPFHNHQENLQRYHDSRASSLRSESSRHHQAAYYPSSRLHSPYPSSSQCPSYSPGSTSSLSGEDEFGNDSVERASAGDGRRLFSVSSRNTEAPPRISVSELPPPPTDYELEALRVDEDDEDAVSLQASQLPPSISNKSYSSLLNTPFSMDMPTPAAARSVPFHPDRYLISHKRNMSDASLAATDSYPGSNYSLDVQVSESRNPVRIAGSHDTPRPPQRHDSERQCMSSLSEEEGEGADLLENRSRPGRRKRNERPPIDPSSKARRHQRKSAKRQHKFSGAEHCNARPTHNSSNPLLSNSTSVL